MTEPGSPLRVVVADDHPLFRDGLVAALAAIDGVQVVATAADGEQAITATREHAPDVVLMDLAMPGVNGIDATRAISQTHPATAVLVLTMAENDASLTAALRAGARGYLLKGADRQEITNALRSVAAGQAVFGAGVADRILGRLTSPPRPRPATSDAFPQLTEREVEILGLLARGLSNRAIATRLFLSVRNHVSNVLAKTGAPDRETAADLARRAGVGTHPTEGPQTPLGDRRPDSGGQISALPASVRVRKSWMDGVWWPWPGAWPSLLPVPDSWPFVRAAVAGQGARSARVAAPEASLTRPAVSR